MIERLNSEELAALALADQCLALNEIISEASIIGRELRKARACLADAKKRVLLCSVSAEKDALKASVIDAQLIVQYLLDRSRMLREAKSVLQSLIRVGTV